MAWIQGHHNQRPLVSDQWSLSFFQVKPLKMNYLCNGFPDLVVPASEKKPLNFISNTAPYKFQSCVTCLYCFWFASSKNFHESEVNVNVLVFGRCCTTVIGIGGSSTENGPIVPQVNVLRCH